MFESHKEKIKPQLVIIVLPYQCINFGIPFVEGEKPSGGGSYGEKIFKYLVGGAVVGVGAGGAGLRFWY
jgi:hypothetical protein